MPIANFVMSLQDLDVDTVEAALFECGAQSVTLAADAEEEILEPAPGETPLWTHTRLNAVFDAAVDIDRLRQQLRAALGTEQLPPNELQALEDRIWEREWLQHFGPIRFGERLWVSPHGQREECDGDVTVWLDPGLAFGTGTHATTALCLEWLERQDVAGKNVIDYGCGSGILAIAAVKLGAAAALAVDIDPQALVATRRNAERNTVAERVETTAAIEPGARKCDILMANILAGPLVDLADSLARLTSRGGIAIVSGILENQVSAIADAYVEHFAVESIDTRDGWAALVMRRR